MRALTILGILLACLTGCIAAGTQAGPKAKETPIPPLAPYRAPTPAPDPPLRAGTETVLIRGATVMTAAGPTHAPGHVLLHDGRIQSVGPGPGEAPAGSRILDAEGKYVTPGIIDVHSHMGVFPLPAVHAHQDGNEYTLPVTPQVWAEHAFWPQDPALWRAVSSGLTTIQVLPGSANLIGGRSFVAKLKPGLSARDMRFPGAPQGLKMACGENPKHTHGPKGRLPVSRMGNVAGYREAFQKALEYKRKQMKYERDLTHWADRVERAKSQGKAGEHPGDPPEPPPRDLGLETLVLVLDGRIDVHMHCYRADEMNLVLDLAKSFGFKIRSFHHALEAFKIRHRLARENVAASTWVDWWGFKMEALDGVPQNAAMLSHAGGRPIMHSDSPIETRYLRLEAAKAMTAGRQVGLAITENEALRWVTANPAWALGIEDQVGTLERGKMADVVVWDGHPFSVYTKAAQVFIDGELVFDREAGIWPLTDFDLGISEPGSWTRAGGKR